MCALLFLAWTAEWPLETDRILYLGYWRSPFQVFGPLFVSVPGLSLFPWQLLLLGLAPLCVLRPGAFRRRSWLMDVALLTSLASIALTFVWGWFRGGSAYNGYYQLWRFLVGLLVGLLLISVVRDGRDLRALGLTVLAAALVRGTLAMYFYWTVVRGRIDPPPPHLTTHDDSLLFVSGIVIAVSWALARGGAAWTVALVVCAHLLYAIVLNNRRLAWIELILTAGVGYLALPAGRAKRRATALLCVAAPLFAVYVAVGSGRPEGVFAPARALATAGSYTDASSLARQEEIRNLLYTLSGFGNPVFGTGWGVPYEKLTSVYANFGPEWWQYRYLPHNSLLAIAVFGGLVGLGGIWLVVPTAAFLAARGYWNASGVPDRAAALAALCVLPAYGVQCYGDIGFQSLTSSLILGSAIAAAGKVSAWAESGAAVASRAAQVPIGPVSGRPCVA